LAVVLVEVMVFKVQAALEVEPLALVRAHQGAVEEEPTHTALLLVAQAAGEVVTHVQEAVATLAKVTLVVQVQSTMHLLRVAAVAVRTEQAGLQRLPLVTVEVAVLLGPALLQGLLFLTQVAAVAAVLTLVALAAAQVVVMAVLEMALVQAVLQIKVLAAAEQAG
jgi:hypothetical protein